MHSSRQFRKPGGDSTSPMLTTKDIKATGSPPVKTGIVTQTSAPLYAHKHQEPDLHHNHGHEEKEHDHAHPAAQAPTVLATSTQVNKHESTHKHEPSQAHIYNEKDNQHSHKHLEHDDHQHHNHSHQDYNYNQPSHVHQNDQKCEHGHDHNHDHKHNHSHDHNHDHSHDHSHSDHDHHHHVHQFTPVYTPPLPSYLQLFTNLLPVQKTMFTWFLIHSSIGISLYCMGTNKESLSLVGFAYLMIFDSLGVLNSFVSSVIRTNSAFGISNTRRPFGAHRYEIVFSLGTTIYLLFATMHNTKESLEHFLLEDHHSQATQEDHHLKFSFGMFFLVGAAIGAVCLSSITLRNHDNFVRYLRRRPTTVNGFSYNVINRARGNSVHSLLSNIYSLSIVLCGSIILLSYMFGIVTLFFDKLLALAESVVMFYLGYPTAKALAKVLLQTTPNTVQNGVETRLREIQQNPDIIHVDRVHFWQTTYGKCVGTIEVRIKPEANEQNILQLVYQKLEGLTTNDIHSDETSSELTVSILK